MCHNVGFDGEGPDSSEAETASSIENLMKKRLPKKLTKITRSQSRTKNTGIQEYRSDG